MVQMAHVLCPVDFSDHSRHALDHAATFARWYGAKITALYVHRLAPAEFMAWPNVGLVSLPPMAMTEAQRADAHDALTEFVAGDRAAGVPIQTQVLEELSVASAIADQARRRGADLIAMGTHGRSGFERLLLGSVTEQIIRLAECPVLTVPPRVADCVPRAPMAIERIVCAVDFSAASAQVLALAVSLATTFDATLTVLHVLELLPDTLELPFGASAYRATRFEDARARLDALLTPTMRNGCRTQELFLGGRPSREILRVAAEQQCGLITLGVHGRGFVDHVFGSTAAHVVRHATCPVMTVGQRSVASVRVAAHEASGSVAATSCLTPV